MHCCPNCSVRLDKTAKVCERCDATFGPGSVWEPIFKESEPPRPYEPNRMPAWDRSWYMAFVIGGILYAIHGIYAGELYIPNKRGGVTVRGPHAIVLAAAVLVAVANLAARVVDHYDRRNNEASYKNFLAATKFGAWVLFVLSFFMPDKW